MKNPLRTLAMLLLITPIIVISQITHDKSDLKILIVALNPDHALVSDIPISPRFAQLSKTRGQEYKNLLKPYFKTVKVINSELYDYTMSNDYDVTIIDDLPKPIDSVDLGQYRNGKSIIRDGQPMLYNRYLPENFDRAVIMTSIITDDLTYGTSSKFVTQCHCLNAHAFNIKTDHAIFNVPFYADLDYEKRPTPKPLKKYYSGINLTDHMQMWRVQKESPEDGNGYMIGQILIGMGFEDSPDSEFISGGESIKDLTGMALGRNANMFHWGFSASPAFMTESAKKVFINTVFYMAQFNGKKPIVKKADKYGRNWIDEFCFRKTGKVIDHIGKTFPEIKNENDTLVKFYTENYDYFTNPRDLTFEVDYDAKSLRISNTNIQLLIKSVELLDDPNEKEKALRILKRYTNYDFDSAKEWKLWLYQFKDYLFFTELGGYKFMVDTYNHPELEVALNNFVLQMKHEQRKAKQINEDEKLTALAELKHIGGNNFILQLSLNIDEGWHAYAKTTPETSHFIQTKIDLLPPTGIILKGDMVMAKTYPYEDLGGVEVYKGLAVFNQNLIIDESYEKKGDFKIVLNYQLCDDYTCKMPTTKEFIIQL